MSAEVVSRPPVGLTGARFDRAHWPDVDDPAVAPPVTAPPPDDPVGQTGARFGGPRRRRRTPPGPPPAITAEPTPTATLPTTDEIPVVVPGSAAVRPYVLTRGRTRAAVALSLDTLLSATLPAPDRPVRPEVRAALALCARPRSFAELAARLGVPLGVAAVLLGDLVGAGLVRVHRATPDTGPDLALMRRVLEGLRRL
ncbi:DUF742 domain-containing protein [Pseudonocardia lacus]|uniref:DUF742 domain-containing protein n=1 Tax=Pseudonocardia lacus TaxID=2835865 RepID=UPI001BDC210A|nr:DUF742 domain-containing protein [Pseudonocardia lacus]